MSSLLAMAYPNQKTSAENIRHVFLEKRYRYAILWSQCQAGKTGAYQELIRLMLKHGDVLEILKVVSVIKKDIDKSSINSCLYKMLNKKRLTKSSDKRPIWNIK